MAKIKKIYVALPSSGLRKKSFIAANHVAGHLISKGHYVFSPITHSQPISKTNTCTNNHQTWLRQDKKFVEWCDEIHVVVIDGNWGLNKIKKSTGVQRELKWAKTLNKKVKYCAFDSKTLTYTAL